MRVRFTQRAQRDLAEIQDYISQDSPTIASRFVTRLIERAWKIGDHPMAGRTTDEPDVRVIVAPRLRYLIFYTVQRTRYRLLISAMRLAAARAVGDANSFSIH